MLHRALGKLSTRGEGERLPEHRLSLKALQKLRLGANGQLLWGPLGEPDAISHLLESKDFHQLVVDSVNQMRNSHFALRTKKSYHM